MNFISILILSVSITLGWSVSPQARAERAGEELSMSRVMHVFGMSLIPADRLAANTTPAQAASVSDPDLERAIEGIDRAIAMAVAASAPDCSLALQPGKKAQTDPSEYTQKYLGYMGEFLSGLQVYKSLFQEQLRLPAEHRDFTAIYEQRLELRRIVSESHQNL